MRKCRRVLYSQTGHRLQYNMLSVPFMLEKKGYRHTFQICNTYCFSMAKMVTWTCLEHYIYIAGLTASQKRCTGCVLKECTSCETKSFRI